ncbi:MAG: helix-turn-helix domain-containing protein [Actinobacteria bacterium]|nr:helix-turn-helix domain-containing protein [Actinomycetota bacterium]
MDVSVELKALLDRVGISQAELARRAGVSQPTVSRAMKRAPARKSDSYARLCNYIRQESNEIPLPGPACDALAEIWDGSPTQAEALAALIRAAGDLSRAGATEDSP